jgi:NADP-dependent 3-hydroxy acid dehydrogenase YdfG
MTQDQFRVDNKIAIVTGAASGIGKATVAVLCERGATVVAADRDSATLEKEVEELYKD